MTASADNVMLSEDNADLIVITFTWPEVDYHIDAPVTYTLQFTTPADTVGTTSWGNVTKIEADDDILTKSLLGSELNTIALNLGIERDSTGTIIIRVKSFVDRAAYSDPLAISVTPYTVKS